MRNQEIPHIRDMILKTLRDACEKVILFSSYAYGTPWEESDIDIYVVLKDGSKNPVLGLQDIYGTFGDHKCYEVDVLANYQSRFEYRSTGGPTMERTIRQKGMYYMIKLDLLKEWIKHAKSNLNTAKHMFDDVYPKENEIAAYHSQQCAEKSLKVFLFAHNIEPPRTHDLQRLCNICKNIDSGFFELDGYCRRLVPFVSKARYLKDYAS